MMMSSIQPITASKAVSAAEELNRESRNKNHKQIGIYWDVYGLRHEEWVAEYLTHPENNMYQYVEYH